MTNGDYEPERERGIFTTRDRQFLLGELDEELDENARRQKRYRLRKRMYHAIQDLAYLNRFDIDDLGQLVDDLLEDVSADEEGRIENPRAVGRVTQGTRSIVEFYRELFDQEMFQRILTTQLEIAAALDHYEATGRYGRYEASLDVEFVEELTIEELRKEMKRRSDGLLAPALPGGRQVLDLQDWGDTPPEITASEDLSEEAETVLTVADERADDSGAAPTDDVVDETARRCEVTEDEARSALLEALGAGMCYRTEDGRLKTI